jgi:chitinase
MNGFSQPTSDQLPPGTWENGVYDYDDLKKNYLPTYARFWDDQSKVPFLFNKDKCIWITYDDLQSNTIKNNYILQENLAGAMFWELSGDRSVELIGNTYSQLSGRQSLPPPTPTSSNTTTTTTQTTTVTTTATTSAATRTAISGNILPWTVNKSNHVGDRVEYQGNIYQCLQAHTSLANWTPTETPALWQRI